MARTRTRSVVVTPPPPVAPVVVRDAPRVCCPVCPAMLIVAAGSTASATLTAHYAGRPDHYRR